MDGKPEACQKTESSPRSKKDLNTTYACTRQHVISQVEKQHKSEPCKRAHADKHEGPFFPTCWHRKDAYLVKEIRAQRRNSVTLI